MPSCKLKKINLSDLSTLKMEDYHAEDVFSSELFKTGSKSGGCRHCFVGVFDSTRYVRGNSEKHLIPQDLTCLN